MAKEFILNDESVLNDRGFRVMTAGIRLEQFEKNPLGLFMHARANKWDVNKDSILPICQWTNLRKEGGKLYGTPVFDESDEFAVKIMNKVENGFLRMCSMGLEPITTSSDATYLLPGQRYETVVDSMLLEVSIADLSSNPNTIALYTRDENGGFVELAADKSEAVVKLIKDPEQETETDTNSEENMKNIALKLSLAENATEDQIVEAIGKLQTSKAEAETKLANQELSAITSVVELAVTEKRITADKKDQMIELGKKVGSESLKSTLELMKPVGKPTDVLNKDTGTEGSDTKITLAKLIESGVDKVEAFKAENPAEYAKLYKEHYGVTYRVPIED